VKAETTHEHQSIRHHHDQNTCFNYRESWSLKINKYVRSIIIYIYPLQKWIIDRSTGLFILVSVNFIEDTASDVFDINKNSWENKLYGALVQRITTIVHGCAQDRSEAEYSMSIQKRFVFKIHGLNNVTIFCLKLRGSAFNVSVKRWYYVLALLLVEDNGD